MCAIDVDPRYADAYYNRAEAKYVLLDYQGAISDYTKAIEINPQYENAYHFRGFATSMI